MSGERGLYRNLRSFQITDFADHHHVRILAQDSAQAARERHINLGVDLGLTDAVDVVLDRILDRHDVAAGIVEPEQRTVQRRALARTRGARDQKYTVRALD